MLKNILKLEGANELNAQQQKGLKGGISQACINAQAEGCIAGPYSGCLKVGGSYYATCRCCYID